jgi:hypothetical protein
VPPHLSATSAETGAKTLELIREVLPSTRRVAVLANATDPFSRVLVEFIENGGRTLGIAIQAIRVRGADEFDAAFAAMAMSGTARPDLGERWPSRLVAATSKNCLRACAHHWARIAGRDSLFNEACLGTRHL